MTLLISVAKALLFLWCVVIKFLLLTSSPNYDDLLLFVIVQDYDDLLLFVIVGLFCY